MACRSTRSLTMNAFSRGSFDSPASRARRSCSMQARRCSGKRLAISRRASAAAARAYSPVPGPSGAVRPARSPPSRSAPAPRGCLPGPARHRPARVNRAGPAAAGWLPRPAVVPAPTRHARGPKDPALARCRALGIGRQANQIGHVRRREPQGQVIHRRLLQRAGSRGQIRFPQPKQCSTEALYGPAVTSVPPVASNDLDRHRPSNSSCWRALDSSASGSWACSRRTISGPK